MVDEIILINTVETGQIELLECQLDWNEDETCNYKGLNLKFAHKNKKGEQPLNTY